MPSVEIPQGGANGVILAQGGRFGGWSLYFKNGKPVYTYNFLGLQRFNVGSAQAVPSGKATIRFEFAYDGGGLGKGGVGTIYVNDKKVAEGRIERTQPMIFSADETADVGEDDATPGNGRLQGVRQQVHRQDRQDHHRPEGNENGRKSAGGQTPRGSRP